MALGKFIGGRLRDARLARGVTASMLAERVGVSPGAISQYETRDVMPRAPTLARMSEILELPEAYFLRPTPQLDPAPHLYRSRAAATKRARESAQVRHGWLREIVSHLEEYVEFPDVATPELDVPPDPNLLRDDDIERSADHLREYWKLGRGPVPNVVELLEAIGCVVTCFAFGAEKLSAFSQVSRERPYVILNAEEGACARVRFNAAHELGHIVLHRAVSPATAAKPEMHKLMEKQAHRFASAFLFPASSFADEVYSLSLESLLSIKSRWRVSMQMMIHRARDLELISQDRYERMFRDLSRRGYRTAEPLDDKIPTETPSLLAKSIMLTLDERATTREALLQRMPFAATDIEILTGLPRGYLQDQKWGQIAHVKLRERVVKSESNAERNGQVIPFRQNR